MIPRIALTSGEPAGIGPDLCILLAQIKQSCEIVVLADPDLIKQRAKALNIKLCLKDFDPNTPPRQQAAGTMLILPSRMKAPVTAGQLNPENSPVVLEMITTAAKGCLQGQFDAMVTAPVQKSIINEAGIAFSGHTEFIAALTGGHPVMMLATPGLRVALLTTHLPLAAVSKAVTADTLTQVIKILDRDLRHYFNIEQPNFLVCGLNPHAGEDGHLGREEIEIIEPTLHYLRGQQISLQGPLPADTLFTPKYLDKADAVLAMYHDQGLPVLKYKGFGNAVNITLGLPIIRTSVDHGTALNLAGSGQASIGSLEYAIHIAQKMSENIKRNAHA
jgi:4-hydroxythreonine-4-phosphate dehydrogenase